MLVPDPPRERFAFEPGDLEAVICEYGRPADPEGRTLRYRLAEARAKIRAYGGLPR